MLTKRELFKGTAALTLSAMALSPGHALFARQSSTSRLIDKATPITAEERLARLQKAQDLMRDRKIGGLLLEPGASMEYFTGLKWWRSERLIAVVIPAEGEIGIIAPSFEERSIREAVGESPEIRTWYEHENPYKLVAEFLRDRKSKGPLAIENSVRFFVVDALRHEVSAGVKNGSAIVNSCRILKSPAELALMQVASDITMAAYTKTFAALDVGMTPADIKRVMTEATKAEGGTPTFTIALIDEPSSYPHGSTQPQIVKNGSIVLMDCGCDVYGYKSDISRTFVLGEPTAKQQRVWDVVKKGQELALETAKVGTPAGLIDDTVRSYYAREGFGPDYQTPGLTHRLGHGIGMETHEPINFVRGEGTPLAPGMCLSNEPGIYLPGEFGVRLEDCIYMTDEGPQLFTGLSKSITDPMSRG